MRQRHPTRLVLLLAGVSMAGIVGQLLVPTGWAIVPLALTLAPLSVALAAHHR